MNTEVLSATPTPKPAEYKEKAPTMGKEPKDDTTRAIGPLSNRNLAIYVAALLLGSGGGNVVSSGLFGGNTDQLRREIIELKAQSDVLKNQFDAMKEDMREMKVDMRELRKRLEAKGIANEYVATPPVAGDRHTLK